MKRVLFLLLLLFAAKAEPTAGTAPTAGAARTAAAAAAAKTAQASASASTTAAARTSEAPTTRAAPTGTAQETGRIPASRRSEIYNTGVRFLDNGQNARAASFFQKHLKDYPALIEAADAFIEAEQRACRYDSALAWLDSGIFATGWDKEPQVLFLDAHRLRKDRDFGGAAVKFREAAELSLSLGDTMSAVFCFRISARSALGARDAEGSLSVLEELQRLISRLEGTDRLAVEAVVIRGEANNLLDRLDEADSLYQQALQATQRRGYRRIRSYALNGLGKLHDKRQSITDAVSYYRQALTETRTLGATETIAALLNNLGLMEIRLKNFDVAGEYLDEARQLALSCGTDWLLGYIYYGLGATAEAKNDLETSKTLFRQSTEHHHERGNTWGELGARLRLAYSHMNLGEYLQAIEQSKQCLEAYEASGSLYGMSWALGGLGLAHHRLGNFKEAKEYYTRTFDVRDQLGDKRGAAWCLNSLGMVSNMQGNYRQALAYEHDAMEIYEALDDRTGVGSVLFSIGSVYYYLGNFSKSMEQYERAYTIATEEDDTSLLERVVSGMGSVYHAAGRMDLAEKFYLEHLAMSKTTGNQTGIIWSLNNIASFYIQTGDKEKAHGYLEEALSLLPEQGMDHIRSRALFLHAKTLESTEEAIHQTKMALELAEMNGLKELQWKYLSDLGEYYRQQGNVPQAKQALEKAILAVESLRRGVGSDELRRHMLRPAIPPFGRMVSLIVGSTRRESASREAFEYTERLKAQIFASLLREALSRIGREDDVKLDFEKDLISQLSHIQSRLQYGNLDQIEKERLLGEMERIERELLQREIQLAAEQEDYAATVYPTMAKAATLLASLEVSERMLSYFLGQERSFLFTSKGDEVEVFVLPARTVVEEKAGFYIRVLRQLAGEEQGSSDTPSVARGTRLPPEVLDRASEELYDLLLGPVADRLEPGERLVILPDGILNRLPFSLLRFHGRYLVEAHEIFYAPSLQSLYYLRKRETTRKRGVAEDRLDVIALGSSGAPAGDRGTRRLYPFTDIMMEPLPRAAEEARVVAGMYKKSLALTGNDASERSFKSTRLDRADILHIAAHSYIDNEDVRRSFIALSPAGESGESGTAGGEMINEATGEEVGGETSAATGEETAPPEDGLLQWHEIAGLRLNASLVTLSACKAAGGVLAVGEGITGLTQAFLYAGGNCVLASFIDVPDRYAGRFMTAFYKHLKNGVSGASALRAAQLEAMKWNDIARSPALWGSFALIGDGSFVTTP